MDKEIFQVAFRSSLVHGDSLQHLQLQRESWKAMICMDLCVRKGRVTLSPIIMEVENSYI